MQVVETELQGVLYIEPKVFYDQRGFFTETYQQNRYTEAGIPVRFVQDNLSSSCRNTLRGLHYQIKHAQGKLVYVVRGEIFDVAVDLRRDSSTFGKWTGRILNDENRAQLYIPPGFAHGFAVLSEVAEFCYKCSDNYHPEHERTLLWNDPALGIDWPIEGDPILSSKDEAGKTLAEADCYDNLPV